MHAAAAKPSDIAALEKKGYFFEPKLDGIRAICEIRDQGADIICRSRNNKKISIDIKVRIMADSCVIDSELVSYDEKGIPRFQLLQQNAKGAGKQLVAFDILEKDGTDLTILPLSQRKQVLKETIIQTPDVQVIFHTTDGTGLWREVESLGAEGIIAKKADSLYKDTRSRDWLKIKLEKSVDAVLIGKGQALRSFMLGMRCAEDRQDEICRQPKTKDGFVHIGNVGTGFDERTVKAIHSLLEQEKRPVAEIRYHEVTSDGRLRAPVFVRLRGDKSPMECTVSQLFQDTQNQLDEYKSRRNFQKTSEPTPDRGVDKAVPDDRSQMAGDRDPNPVFAIQRHDARALHYDLRLEHEGVLKSWAIPKNLSKSPSDKRLAVQTEDHPFAYKDFEDTIPKGEYGAGTVTIWDRGHFVNITIKKGKVQPLSEAMDKGHFLIWMKGQKTEGGYAFTRTKDKNWIAVRMKEKEKDTFPAEIKADGHSIKITNPGKDLYAGIRKGDLVDYYDRVASLMLPHIRGRPISMYRFPEGVHDGFFQKDIPNYFPSWISRISLKHEKKTTTYVLCNDRASIVYLANQVTVPHIMSWTVDNLSRAKKAFPDKIVFDLDPDRKDMHLLKDTARNMKRFLEDIGFDVFIMTTGGKGYHVAVPIQPELEVRQVRDFAGKVAETFARSDPSSLTTDMRKDRRMAKILIDVNRNSPMQTSVCPYAARAAPGLPIAKPISWKDLDSSDPQTYSIFDKITRDPWEDFFRKRVSIKKIIDDLRS